jgi:hypothetical protein
MTSITHTEPRVAPSTATPVVALERRTVDKVLVGAGVVMTVALVVAGSLLSWGASFSDDYVYDELSSQNVFFPPAAALEEEGRDDLVRFAELQVTTGEHAEAYASYIDGHLAGIADGATYADLGDPEFAARDALASAKESGASEAEIAKLQGEYDKVSGQRNTLFKGETLRGLLLSAFAWSTVGTIAGYAAIGAFTAAALMLVLVVLGVFHERKLARQIQ